MSNFWVCASCHCLVWRGGRGIIFWITVGRGWWVNKSSHIVYMAWRMDHLNFFQMKIQREPNDLMFPFLYLIVSQCLHYRTCCVLSSSLETTWKPFRSLIPSTLPVKMYMETHPLDLSLLHLLAGDRPLTSSVAKGLILWRDIWSFFQSFSTPIL